MNKPGFDRDLCQLNLEAQEQYQLDTNKPENDNDKPSKSHTNSHRHEIQARTDGACYNKPKSPRLTQINLDFRFISVKAHNYHPFQVTQNKPRFDRNRRPQSRV